MTDDPMAILDGLDRVEDAFGGFTHGQPTYEAFLDPGRSDPAIIQLRKACRLLDTCRLLRDRNGYYTSVVEMSFAAIERSLEGYALYVSNDSIDDFRAGHERAYERAAELGALSPKSTARLKDVFVENRSASYYRDTIANERQSAALFTLAVRIHEHIYQFAGLSHECRCES